MTVKTLAFGHSVLQHSQVSAACDDLVGRTPRGVPSGSADPLVGLWLRLRCSVGQALVFGGAGGSACQWPISNRPADVRQEATR